MHSVDELLAVVVREQDDDTRWTAIQELHALGTREVFEREYLIAQVTRFGGNISRTASFVGMERSALHRKLKSLGVHGDDRGNGSANGTD